MEVQSIQQGATQIPQVNSLIKEKEKLQADLDRALNNLE
jgi:hypothetical protein